MKHLSSDSSSFVPLFFLGTWCTAIGDNYETWWWVLIRARGLWEPCCEYNRWKKVVISTGTEIRLAWNTPKRVRDWQVVLFFGQLSWHLAAQFCLSRVSKSARVGKDGERSSLALWDRIGQLLGVARRLWLCYCGFIEVNLQYLQLFCSVLISIRICFIL